MKQLILILIFSCSSFASYVDTVKSVQPSHLIQYLPMNEISGSTAYDSSGNNRNGTYSTGTVLNQTAMTNDVKCVDMSNSAGLNSYGAALSTVFNADSGTVMLWLKPKTMMLESGNLINLTSAHDTMQLKTESDSIVFRSVSDTGTITYRVARRDSVTMLNNWYCYIIRWRKNANMIESYSNDTRVFYQNLDQNNFRYSNWVGWRESLTSCLIAGSFNGYVCNFAVWNTPLTRSEINKLSKLMKKRYRVAFIGDSQTYGVTFNGTGYRSTEHYSYPGYLMQLMGPSASYCNMGISGGPLQNTLLAAYNGGYPDNGIDSYVYRALDYGVDTVFVMYGTNDFIWQQQGYFTDQQFADAYDTLVNKLKIAGKTVICLTIPKTTGYGYANRLTNNYNIVKTAKKYGVKYVDIYNGLSDLPDSLCSGDNLHFTVSGYMAIAQMVYSQMHKKYTDKKFWGRYIQITTPTTKSTSSNFVYSVDLSAYVNEIASATNVGVYSVSDSVDVPKIAFKYGSQNKVTCYFIGKKSTTQRYTYDIYWGGNVKSLNDADGFRRYSIGNFVTVDDSMDVVSDRIKDIVNPYTYLSREGSTTTQINGKFGLARKFSAAGGLSGTSTYNYSSAYANDSTFAVSYWVKFDSMPVSGSSLFLTNYTSGTNEFTFYYINNSIRLYFNNGTTGYYVSNPLTYGAGNWYNVAVVVNGYQTQDANRVKFYVNGSKSNTFSGSGFAATGSTSNSISLGGSTTGYELFGAIDNYIVLNDTLDSLSVVDMYNSVNDSSFLYYSGAIDAGSTISQSIVKIDSVGIYEICLKGTFLETINYVTIDDVYATGLTQTDGVLRFSFSNPITKGPNLHNVVLYYAGGSYQFKLSYKDLTSGGNNLSVSVKIGF